MLTTTLVNQKKPIIKNALLGLIKKFNISPEKMQNKFKIPVLILTNSKTNRPTLVFYLIKLFQQIISLKLRA